MAISYQNEQQFADALLDRTLSTLRDQRDDKQLVSFTGSLTVNSASITSKHPQLVQGPVAFDSPFKVPPAVTFGQQPASTPSISSVQRTSLSTGYTPFLVIPYVHSWRNTNGVIDGFYLGLYAVVIPAKTSAHIIFWRADGKGTTYPGERLAESWTERYDHNEAGFLNQDTGNSGFTVGT